MKVLVVFHIYYPDLAPYYIEQLKNLSSFSYDLIVTGDSLAEDVVERIRAVKDDAVFLHTDNIGYDIWPFICAVKSVNLADYSFIVKLHTKNEDGFSIVLNGMEMDGKMWRSELVSPLVGSPEKFALLSDIFTGDSKVGIAYNRQLGFISKGVHPEDCKMLDDELSRLGIVRRKSNFCAGTMFAVRASTLEFLKAPAVNPGVFECSGPSHSGATMAHVYERLIPIAVQSQGYGYFPLYDSFSAAVRFKVKDLFTPILEWIFSVNHYGGAQRKCITVFGTKHFVRVR